MLIAVLIAQGGSVELSHEDLGKASLDDATGKAELVVEVRLNGPGRMSYPASSAALSGPRRL
ncbi:hypothetical protein [Actinomadura rubrisoli]|uniref:Uncharacterized protein n=1 Tax=Actinomadura rubrisoli TaxID=2530368 RepID=A0A4R5CFH1_9ACTN|nr:hypothetical protein [Actinomadura rubrisoli]TDD97716.1 hypothetical protein E1298_01380 [Actinomadura rubrisoli]